MQIDDCSVVTVLEGAGTTPLLSLHPQSWLDELNALSPLHAAALLSSTALIWYVAWGIRTTLNLLGHTSKNEE